MAFASRRWLPAFCAILLFLAACAEVPSRVGASPAPAGKIVLSEGRATPAGSRAHPNRQAQLLPIPVVIAVYELAPVVTEIAVAIFVLEGAPTASLAANYFRALRFARLPGFEFHHMAAVASKVGRARECRRILERVGLPVHSAANGVPLPKVFHRKLDNSNYYAWLLKKLEGRSSRDEVIQVLNEARSELLDASIQIARKRKTYADYPFFREWKP